MLFRLELEKLKKSGVGVLPHSGGKTPFDWGITPKGGRLAPDNGFSTCVQYRSIVGPTFHIGGR